MPKACPLLLIVSTLVLGGCAAAPDTAEEQIRARISSAARAAEEKDVGALRGMLAAQYSDSRGHDRRAIAALVRLYLLRNHRVYVYTLIKTVQVSEDNRGSARILVAMAGQPVEAAEQLLNVRADLVLFDIDFVFTDDEWKVIGAQWERAGVDDFLPVQL